MFPKLSIHLKVNFVECTIDRVHEGSLIDICIPRPRFGWRRNLSVAGLL
jgi:hypothetical protein